MDDDDEKMKKKKKRNLVYDKNLPKTFYIIDSKDMLLYEIYNYS